MHFSRKNIYDLGNEKIKPSKNSRKKRGTLLFQEGDIAQYIVSKNFSNTYDSLEKS